mgnify:CR=1 FL=1
MVSAIYDSQFTVQCVHCLGEFVILANEADVSSWKRGDKYIQDALGYLSAGDRELFISQTCDGCFRKMYELFLDPEE